MALAIGLGVGLGVAVILLFVVIIAVTLSAKKRQQRIPRFTYLLAYCKVMLQNSLHFIVAMIRNPLLRDDDSAPNGPVIFAPAVRALYALFVLAFCILLFRTCAFLSEIFVCFSVFVRFPRLLHPGIYLNIFYDNFAFISKTKKL